MRRILNYVGSALSKALGLIIRLYQLLISPILGNNCRFHPTCSQYAIEALSKKPLTKSIPLIIKRVSKCHPFHSGGYDPVK